MKLIAALDMLATIATTFPELTPLQHVLVLVLLYCGQCVLEEHMRRKPLDK